MRYSEKWGDSIEVAFNLALQDLQLTREQVKVTVLEEPSRGFLGIGAKEKLKAAQKKAKATRK